MLFIAFCILCSCSWVAFSLLAKRVVRRENAPMRRRGFLLKAGLSLKRKFEASHEEEGLFAQRGPFSEKRIVVLNEKIGKIIPFLALVQYTPNLRRSEIKINYAPFDKLRRFT